MRVRVGTSGWSYDDWEGAVYPPSLPAADRLGVYAIRFPTVEIDSTYYGDPTPGMVKGWLAKTKGVEGFEFSVKAPGTLTHEALVDAEAPDIRGVAVKWRALVADPLARAGRLGAVLLQLSPAVTRRAASLERLDVALDALAPHACAVEFRNHTWHTDAREPSLDPDTLELLDAHGACAVVVDGPSFPAIVAGRADHAFVRFHGRNADRWFKPERYYGDRYDYLYSEEELAPWAARVAKLAEEKEVVRVFFNNHVGGQAFQNGDTFERMLQEEGASVVKAQSPQKRLL